MKLLNKVIAAMMTMAITFAMPAMAANKKHTNHDNKTTVMVVTNDKTTVSTSRQASLFDKSDKRTSQFDAHKKNAYRMSRLDAHPAIVVPPQNRALSCSKDNSHHQKQGFCFDEEWLPCLQRGSSSGCFHGNCLWREWTSEYR